MTFPNFNFLPRDPTITRDDRVQYRSVIETVSDEWMDNPPIIYAAPGTQEMYDETTEAVIDLIETHPDQAKRFENSSAARDGIGIINSYMYLGARTLAEHQAATTVPDVEKLMRHPKTFSNLHRITREHRKSAGEIERTFGLRSTPFASPSEAEPVRYQIGSDGELDMVQFDQNRDEIRERLFYDGDITMKDAFSVDPDKDPVRCKGSRLIPVTYRAMLHICVQDPRLFQATIDQNHQ